MDYQTQPLETFSTTGREAHFHKIPSELGRVCSRGTFWEADESRKEGRWGRKTETRIRSKQHERGIRARKPK